VITCAFEDGKRALLRHVVVHAIVEREGAVLLVKRAPHLGEGGKWGLPGGFLDRDENLEQAVLRELREETGWRGEVRGLLRVNSRPDRPRDRGQQNVAFDFLVAALERVGEPDHEQTAVDWVPLDRLPPLAFDHGESVALYVRTRGRALAPSVE
jgi:8-oxo-dGTP diphosphatase